MSFLLSVVWAMLSLQVPAAPAAPAPAVSFGAASDLIAEVNALRAANGLPPYNVHPILMQIAQAHSEYQAAIGSVTHYGPNGERPFQRALAAGYPVAGDLSRGGFFSENIMAGPDLTPAEAVAAWQGDAPHLNTMLSPNLQDVGAGVAVSGGMVYYTLDAGLASGSAVSYTPSTGDATAPPPNGSPTAVVVIPNTPQEDGSIVHIVQPGETLWAIAVAYDVTVDDLIALNRLSGATIYPGDRLLIRQAFTETPPPPTATRTRRPTATSAPTRAATATATARPSPTPTAAGQAVLSSRTGAVVVLAIVVSALVLAGVLTRMSARSEP